MPTDEYKPLLDRAGAITTAQPLIDVACPLLREVVNHASMAFRRCDAASDSHGSENEDLAAFVLYRHMIELVDGVERLFSASCVEAAVPLLRAELEASLSLDYILQADYTRRSLAWTCADIHSRIAARQRLDPRTAIGAEFEAALNKEWNRGFAEAYDAGPSVAALGRVLDRDQFRDLNAEYLKLKGKKLHGPDWFRLVGVKNRRALAKEVGRESEYLSFYSEWSGFSHASAASPYVTSADQPGLAAFISGRSSQHMPHRAFFAVSWMLRATRQMLQRFRPGEPLNAWYLREVQRPFQELQRIRVTMW
jgi:hypothetical protein